MLPEKSIGVAMCVLLNFLAILKSQSKFQPRIIYHSCMSVTAIRKMVCIPVGMVNLEHFVYNDKHFVYNDLTCHILLTAFLKSTSLTPVTLVTPKPQRSPSCAFINLNLSDITIKGQPVYKKASHNYCTGDCEVPVQYSLLL